MLVVPFGIGGGAFSRLVVGECIFGCKVCPGFLIVAAGAVNKTGDDDVDVDDGNDDEAVNNVGGGGGGGGLVVTVEVPL